MDEISGSETGSTMFNDVISTHAHINEWQLQLEFENGEEFGFFFYKETTFKSITNNESVILRF